MKKSLFLFALGLVSYMPAQAQWTHYDTQTAISGVFGAISGGEKSTCGNIVILGGIIKATGGAYAAGIGSGNHSSCDNITISGGAVEATGGQHAAGIGGGQLSTCGNITISKSTDFVKATKGSEASYSIGAGLSGTCGTVTVCGVVGAIEEDTYDYSNR